MNSIQVCAACAHENTVSAAIKASSSSGIAVELTKYLLTMDSAYICWRQLLNFNSNLLLLDLTRKINNTSKNARSSLQLICTMCQLRHVL